MAKQLALRGGLPPSGTIYSKLPDLTVMGRLLDQAEPTKPVLESLGRELQRAAGIRADEPDTADTD